jgi:endonuclease/exonuclease/phosphatase (EEP) superfamily protein YafD
LHTALRAHLHDAFEQAGTGFGPTIRFLDVVPLRVDFVYTTDDVVPVDARVLDDRCSDHQAVVVDVDLR